MARSDRYIVEPVPVDGRTRTEWAVRDSETWEIDSQHASIYDAQARAERKNDGRA
ncbi:hypothetical protein [Streptomyces sp. NPDC059649]|uniref:hypothetical protein n=1 Tax=Streptomyces sp. NPDC059649 TaxID=3346895 RepID=UPI003680A81D